jgi:hypothetical protein
MVNAIDNYADFKNGIIDMKTLTSYMNKGGKKINNFKGGGGGSLRLDNFILNSLPILKGGYKEYKTKKVGGEQPFNIFADSKTNNDLYNSYVSPTFSMPDMKFKTYDYPAVLTPQRDLF